MTILKSTLDYESAIIDFERGGTHIYFIQFGEKDDGPIKIGRAHRGSIQSRLCDLQIGSPEPLRLLAHFAALPEYERVLHKMFEEDRIRGEWYRATPDLLEVVDIARSNDVIPLLAMIHRLAKSLGMEFSKPRPLRNYKNRRMAY